MREEDINSLDSEGGVIATLIHHPDFYFHAEGSLLPNHFSSKENRIVYTAIQMLAKQSIERIDAYNILEILNSSEATRQYASEITIDQLNELVDMSEYLSRNTVEEYKLLVKNILDASFRRDALVALKECRELCLDRSCQEIDKQIYDIIDGVTTEYSCQNEIPLYKDVVDGIWERVRARQRGETNAISFPFSELNKYVLMEPGEAVCFTGGPKAGKSAMLLSITVDMLRKGKSVLYVDSEISTELFTIRLLSHITGIRFGTIRAGKCSEEEEQRINEAIEWMKSKRFIHIYMPVLSADALYVTAKKAKHMIDIDCIVVDYLKADSSKEQAFEVYANLGAVSDTLKNKIAGDMQICAITAAQSTSTGKIADSSRIARSMSTVVSIIDKSLEEIETDNTGATKKLRVVFNRNGAQMTSENEWIDMVFDGSTCKYTQSERQHVIEEPF